MNEDYFDFYFLTGLIGLTIIASAYLSYRRTHDLFHPAIFVGAQLFFLYVYLPYITVTDIGVVGYLSAEHCSHVQFLNFLGVAAFSYGLSRKLNLPRQNVHLLLKDQQLLQSRTLYIARLIGLMGVGAFYYIAFTSGGFGKIYGHAYGGGWNASGYIREMYLLTVPAILWYFIASGYRRLTVIDYSWLAVFASPLLIHGLLGARRGPTLVIAFTLVMGYYLSRHRRPAPLLFVKGTAALALLLLLLVSNRNKIYLGSDLELENEPMKIFEIQESNEFIYGAGTILNAEYYNRYHYGFRYLTVVFIRPIPRSIWPEKYRDASAWFDIPNLEDNMGTGASEFKRSVGWRGAVGAAPGIIADVWIEFLWGSLLFLFLAGRFLSMSWGRATREGGVWIVFFAILAALSGYLITQTFEAMIFRFLFLAIPSWLVWMYIKRSRLWKLSRRKLYRRDV